jgi:hypothetical protein
MKSIAVIALVLLAGCASPTIILKQGKTWQVAKDYMSVKCIVQDEDGVKQNARCRLNAGDVVVPASAL